MPRPKAWAFGGRGAPWAPWAPWLLVVAGAVAIVWSLGPVRRNRVESIPCQAIALVDGRLVCGDDARTFEDACGTPHALRAGDALEDCQLGRMTADDLAALGVHIDPNEAGAAELQSLPGVGPVLAQRIVQGRPYRSAESLLEVKGIGPRTLARIKPRLSLPDRAP